MTDLALQAPSTALGRAGQYVSALWDIADGRIATFSRMVSEMFVLKFKNGIHPSYYIIGGLTDQSMSWSDKRQYMGPKEYEDLIWSVNDPDYRKISQNKLAEKALLSALGIPTPKLLGFLQDSAGHTADGNPLKTLEDLEAFLNGLVKEGDQKRICFKATESWNGAGFVAVSVRHGSGEPVLILENDGTEVSVKQLFEQLPLSAGAVVEEFIDQHPAYAAYHPSSVNGYRFWVAQDEDGTARPLLGNIRFGCGGAIVDNSGARVLVDLDIETGAMGKAHYLTLTQDWTDAHPDTGTPISGETLPLFEEAKDLACRALSVFPKMRFAGVDIAVSKDGAVVLELNVQPSFLAPALSRMPTRQVLSMFIEKGAK